MLYKVRKAHDDFEERKRIATEFHEKYFCESNILHDFEEYKPHRGCVKMVCRFCGCENPDKLFKPSIYSYKGRRFEFQPKHKFETVRRYDV